MNKVMAESCEPICYSRNLLGLLGSIPGLCWTISTHSCCLMASSAGGDLLELAESLELEDFWQEVVGSVSSFAMIDLPRADRVIKHSF